MRPLVCATTLLATLFLGATVNAQSATTAPAPEPAPTPAPVPTQSQSQSPASAPAPAPGTARLSWVRGAGADACVDASTIERRVREGLGHDPFRPEGAQSLEVSLHRDGARWVATLFVRSNTGALLGSRELVSNDNDCTVITDSLVVALTLAIDPSATLPTPPPPPTPPSLPVQPPTPPVVAPTSPVRPSWARGALSLRSGMAFGLLPSIAPEFAIVGDLGVTGPLRWRAALSFMPEQPTDATAAVRASFGLTQFELHGCVDTLRRETVSLSACALFHVGAVHSVVYELTPVNPGQTPWLAAGVAMHLALRPWRSLLFFLDAEGMLSLLRYQFEIEGRTPALVYEQPLPALHVSAGLGWLL